MRFKAYCVRVFRGLTVSTVSVHSGYCTGFCYLQHGFIKQFIICRLIIKAATYT